MAERFVQRKAPGTEEQIPGRIESQEDSMKRSTFVLATGASALVAASHGTARAASSKLDAFEALVRDLMHRYELPAGTAAVSKAGQLVYAKAFGFSDLSQSKATTLENRFRIASSTKPFTAVAIMLLRDKGTLQLDERAFDVLSDFSAPKGADVDPRLRTITIEQLLHHTGGFDSSKTDPQFDALRVAADALGRPRPAKPRDIIEYMMGQPLAFDPGSKYVYSNLGYNILGRIIERRSGMIYADFLNAHILEPLGMRRTSLGRTQPDDIDANEVAYWDPPTANAMYSVYEHDPQTRTFPYGGFSMEATDAHGGLVSDAVDLTKFLDAVGGSHGHQLLSAKTVAEMVARPNYAFYSGKDKWYGSGWNVMPGVVMGHNGAFTWCTASTVARIPGDVTYAMIFNRLPFDIGKFVVEAATRSAHTLANL
jgi:N-acyl-D-amino-acid deacylase